MRATRPEAAAANSPRPAALAVAVAVVSCSKLDFAVVVAAAVVDVVVNWLEFDFVVADPEAECC